MDRALTLFKCGEEQLHLLALGQQSEEVKGEADVLDVGVHLGHGRLGAAPVRPGGWWHWGPAWQTYCSCSLGYNLVYNFV